MGLNFLENIHHFVSHQIEDEIIWPFSMPPFIKSDADIPIASYGSSNLALFKKTYRNGLSHRYGRTMQAISGIHVNYSFPEQIWQSTLFKNENFLLNETFFVVDIFATLFSINWDFHKNVTTFSQISEICENVM